MIALGELEKTLSDTRDPDGALAVAIIPMFGLRWNKEARERVFGLPKLVRRLRNSNLQLSAYLRLGNIFDGRMNLACPLPDHRGEWASVCGKFEIGSSLRLPTRKG